MHPLLPLLVVALAGAAAATTDPYTVAFSGGVFALNRTAAPFTIAGKPLVWPTTFTGALWRPSLAAALVPGDPPSVNLTVAAPDTLVVRSSAAAVVLDGVDVCAYAREFAPIAAPAPEPPTTVYEGELGNVSQLFVCGHELAALSDAVATAIPKTCMDAVLTGQGEAFGCTSATEHDRGEVEGYVRVPVAGGVQYSKAFERGTAQFVRNTPGSGEWFEDWLGTDAEVTDAQFRMVLGASIAGEDEERVVLRISGGNAGLGLTYGPGHVLTFYRCGLDTVNNRPPSSVVRVDMLPGETALVKLTFDKEESTTVKGQTITLDVNGRTASMATSDASERWHSQPGSGFWTNDLPDLFDKICLGPNAVREVPKTLSVDLHYGLRVQTRPLD